jgi:hypothetical protein
MATQTITRLIDDIDGSPAERTVRFSVDGDEYEIDLAAPGIEQLRTALEPWVSAARKVTARRRTRTTGKAATKDEMAAIRTWAKANGHAVADRGRIPAEVVTAYQSRSTTPPAAKKAAAKKAPAIKKAVRKATAKKAPSEKATARKTAAKKAPAKKAAAAAKSV